MPLIPVNIALAGDPTTSPRNTTQGLLELVDIRYDNAPAVQVAIELCIADDGTTQTYTEIWRSPSSNSAAYYLPTQTTTLPTGSAGQAEAHIPLRSPHGWRLRVIGGASTGSVTATIGLDQ